MSALTIPPSILAALVVGPVQFDRPVWLLLVPALGAATWWIGRKSLSGLVGGTRWTAFIVRLLVITLLAGSLAEPQLRRVSRDVAVTVVLDASRSVPIDEQRAVDVYVAEARRVSAERGDRLGVVTVGKDAFVQALPSASVSGVERVYTGNVDATNLAAGVRMAIAVTPDNAANRMLLISDGNETEGSLLAAAEAARAANIPIDVLPVQYAYPAEVIVERLVAPANARGNETISLSIVISATAPVMGRLMVTANGEPIDLDPDEAGFGAVRKLDVGKNVLAVQIEPQRPGPQSYEASFEPIAELDADGDPLAAGGLGDAILQNNRSTAVTFVGAEGWVMLVGQASEETAPMTAALAEAGLRVNTISAEDFPTSLVDLNGYDAVMLLNQPAYNLSEAQHEIIRQFVNDSGGGLIMTGGPYAFGAGGWIGSRLEDALPIRLDPPQKRQMPRGALALVIHSVEIPQGVYWGKEVCNAAVDALSSRDVVGIVEYQMLGNTDWVFELQEKRDGAAVKRAINQLQFGDMPSFDESLILAADGLAAIDAGQKHCIVISDGDPSLSRSSLKKFVDEGITISCVGAFPHSPSDLRTMQRMADVTGGKYYEITTSRALAELPEIIVKEAQTVKRNLIWEGEAFAPTVLGVPTESMRGIGSVPGITGYVVAADREGLSVVTLRAVRTEQREGQPVAIDDPICAQWQYGLGRVVCFTSDATSRWAQQWVSWGAFKQFWEQHVRWAMRPAGSANIRVLTQTSGSTTEVIVEALDDQGERLNFADFQARASTPDGRGAEVKITQIGPGRYRGTFESSDPGSYVVSMRYRAPGRGDGAPAIEGSVQAAVSRPFADEFRALESNLTLLRQVASATGGRVLDRNPQQDDPWRREGLEMPVALRPIWLAVLIGGITLFLADVGIRRVRIEPRQVVLAVAGLFGRAKVVKRDESQAVSLRQARAKAQSRMRGAGEAQDGAAPVASRKFEAAKDAPAVTGPVALSGEAEKPQISGLSKPKPAVKKDEEEGGMSRLMQAKRRAQEELKDEDQ